MPTPPAPNGTWNCYDVQRSFDGNLQEAVNEAVSAGGGLIYLAAGNYDLTGSLYIPYTEDRRATPITFLGDGPLRTHVRVKPGYTPFHLVIVENPAYTRFVGIHFEGSYERSTGTIDQKWVHGMIVGPPPASLYAGCDGLSRPTTQLIQLSMEQCIIDKVGGYALYVRGDITGWPPSETSLAPLYLSITCTFQSCEFTTAADVQTVLCGGTTHDKVPAAIYIEPHCTTLSFRDCDIVAMKGRGVFSWGCAGLAIQDCRLHAEGTYPAIDALQSVNGQVRHCLFEDAGASATPAYFVRLNDSCHGWTFEQCAFQRNWNESSPSLKPHLLQLASGNASRSVVLLSPNVQTIRDPAGDEWVSVLSTDSSLVVLGGSNRVSSIGVTRPLQIVAAGGESSMLGGTDRLRSPTLHFGSVQLPDTGDLGFSPDDDTLVVRWRTQSDSQWAKVVTD